MLQLTDFNAAGSLINKMNQVKTGEIAGRIVKEHVFRTWITCIDTPAFRAGVPFVDGSIELQTGIRAFPGTEQNFFPKVAGIDCFCNFARCALTQLPEIVVFNRLHELVGHTDGIVGILAANSMVCLRFIIGVVLFKIKRGVSLFDQSQHTNDIAHRYSPA